jgi:endo-1,4-beta-D-glucanase Y
MKNLIYSPHPLKTKQNRSQNIFGKLTSGLSLIVAKIDFMEMFCLVATLALVIFAHSYNMFQFPYYENDEGIYISQAWSLLNTNQLSNYTYFYDHAPAGWMIIAGFVKLLGGFFAFNYSGFASLDTGRIVMLILKVISVLLVYVIIKKQTGKYYLGLVGMVLMSISPLGLYYQRRILLDNVMICVALCALFFVSLKKATVARGIISAIFLGFAVLSKESAIFFVPGFLLLNFLRLSKNERNLGSILYICFFLTIVTLYPVTALLKTELFPSSDRVSLINTLMYQVSRGTKVAFWDYRSDFISNFEIWKKKDLAFVWAFIVTFGISVIAVIGTRSRYLIGVITILLGMVYFLLRGGIVLDFYLVPLIPIGAIIAMLMLNYFIQGVGKALRLNIAKPVILLLIFSTIFALTTYELGSKAGKDVLFKEENTTLAQSLNYAKTNIDNKSNILIDSSHWLDLRNNIDSNFTNADYFYKADYDSEVKNIKLKNDWRSVDYVVASHQQYQSVKEKITPLVKNVLDNSFVVADFQPTDDYVVKHDSRYISVNGNWSTVFKTNNDPALLVRLNKGYNSKYLSSEGQVKDDQAMTTSKGQGYSLLRSVFTSDKDTYDKVLAWTTNNLKRSSDNLFASKYGRSQGQSKILDQENTTDGDLDIAYSLLEANKKWNDNSYLDLAKKIISDIWKNRVIEHNGQKFLLPSTSKAKEGFEIINPSYFSPMYYTEFAIADPTSDWNKLRDNTYDELNKIHQNHFLFPDWVKYNISTQQYETASKDLFDTTTDNFSFEATRIILKIGQDYQRTRDNRALRILELVSQVLDNNLDKSTIKASIDPEGNDFLSYETSATDAMASIALNTTDAKNKSRIWKDLIINKTDYKNGTFNNNEYYYDQNLVWFAYAYDFGFFK